MSTKVTVQSTPKNRISINDQRRETVRFVGGSADVNKNLGDLVDVDVTGASNNYVLVYDASLFKFVFKPIQLIDGGSF